MKRFKKPATVWLARSNHTPSMISYAVGWRKKGFDGDGFDTDNYIASFCDDEFERVTGIKLERGEVVKVRIVLEEPRHDL